MAEIVGSAVVQESVSQIISGLVQKYEGKHNTAVFGNLERLEMAQIRLEAVVQTSYKWNITDTSLLHWRRKLKSAAQECQDTLHRCRERILQDEHIVKEVSNFSLPKRIVHATRSFVSNIFHHDNDDLDISIVQRFEWFVDGSTQFLRLLELGGMPWCHMPFDTLVRHLLAGKILLHRIIRANKCPLFLLLAPFLREGHGIECWLYFMQKDSTVQDDGFFLGVTLQLSESTDILGVVIQCLQLFAPLFISMVEKISEELMQLPTQEFTWVPYVDSQQKKYLDIVHRLGGRWFCPNDPLCCKQQDKHKPCHGRKLHKSSRLPYVSLESVIQVGLRCQVSLLECDKQRVSLPECGSSLGDHPCLRAGVLFTPHASSNDMLLVDKFPSIDTTYSEEQHCLHSAFISGQLREMLLPKAIEYFRQNEEATVYQRLWRSRHGTAYIQVEKARIFMPSTRRRFHGAKRRKLLQGLDEELDCLTYEISHFLDVWATHAPIHLQGLIRDLCKEVKGKQNKHITAA